MTDDNPTMFERRVRQEISVDEYLADLARRVADRKFANEDPEARVPSDASKGEVGGCDCA